MKLFLSFGIKARNAMSPKFGLNLFLLEFLDRKRFLPNFNIIYKYTYVFTI